MGLAGSARNSRFIGDGSMLTALLGIIILVAGGVCSGAIRTVSAIRLTGWPISSFSSSSIAKSGIGANWSHPLAGASSSHSCLRRLSQQ